MITLEALETQYAEHYRSTLAAKGVPASQVERVAAATARAIAPGVLEQLAKDLRQQIIDSPEGLGMLLGPDDRPEGESRAEWLAAMSKRKVQYRAWLDAQVAEGLARMDVVIAAPGAV
jgi:hypothetical protein